ALHSFREAKIGCIEPETNKHIRISRMNNPAIRDGLRMPLVEIKPVGRGNHHGLRLPKPPDGVIDNILLQHIVIAERLLPGYEYMNTCKVNHFEEGNSKLLEIGA